MPLANCVKSDFLTDITHWNDIEERSTVYQFWTCWYIRVFLPLLILNCCISAKESRTLFENVRNGKFCEHLLKH